MKRILILPLLVIVALVSQAVAAGVDCKYPEDGTKLAACEYSNPLGCYSLNTENSGPVKNGTTVVCEVGECTCPQLTDACKKDGALYSFTTKPDIWKTDPWGKGEKCGGTNGGTLEYNSSCEKWCKWPTGCTEIKPNPTDTDNPTTTCEAAIAHCEDNGKLFNDKATCEAYVPPTPSSSSTPATTTSSSSVASGGSSSSVATGGSSSSDAGTSSPSGTSSSSGGTGTSSSSGGTDAIISHNNAPVFGLSVTGLARGLQIASEKNATISLFNMKGKLVLRQKVQSGTTTIGLENQKAGVYYAVAKSDSQKQLVKIVLK